MRQDILLDKTGDVSLDNGIELTANSERVVEQDKHAVITSYTGDYLNTPDIGLNAIDYINDNSANLLSREVNKQCAAVGMKVKAVSFDGVELKIDSEYDTV